MNFTWDVWAPLLQKVLIALGTLLISTGKVDAVTVQNAAGGLVAVIGFVWALFHGTGDAQTPGQVITTPKASADPPKPAA